METTLRDLYSDAALRRVLTLSPGKEPNERQRTRLAKLILSRYETRVNAADSLDLIIDGYNKGECDETSRLRAMKLAVFSDDARVHYHSVTKTAAQAETPAEVLNTMEKKIMSAVKRAADEIGQMCEDEPKHLREAKSLLEEVRSKKSSESWLWRTVAEAAEEVLERAIRYGADAEDDHALNPEGSDEEDEKPAKKDRKKDLGKKPKSKKASVLRLAHGTGVAAKGQKALRFMRNCYSEIEASVKQAGHDPDEVMKLRRGGPRKGPSISFDTGHKLIPVLKAGSFRCELYDRLGNEVCAGDTAECAQVVIESLPRSRGTEFVANLLREKGREDLIVKASDDPYIIISDADTEWGLKVYVKNFAPPLSAWAKRVFGEDLRKEHDEERANDLALDIQEGVAYRLQGRQISIEKRYSGHY